MDRIVKENLTNPVSSAIPMSVPSSFVLRASTIASKLPGVIFALVPTTPAAFDIMDCATSNTAIEKSKAWDTSHTAIHILMIYLKNSKVSVSCIEFFLITT